MQSDLIREAAGANIAKAGIVGIIRQNPRSASMTAACCFGITGRHWSWTQKPSTGSLRPKAAAGNSAPLQADIVSGLRGARVSNVHQAIAGEAELHAVDHERLIRHAVI